MKSLTATKFGGDVIGDQGQGIPQIIRRIHRIKEIDDIGP